MEISTSTASTTSAVDPSNTYPQYDTPPIDALQEVPSPTPTPTPSISQPLSQSTPLGSGVNSYETLSGDALQYAYEYSQNAIRQGMICDCRKIALTDFCRSRNVWSDTG